MHESIIPALEGAGIEIHYHPEARREELHTLLPGMDILIVRSKTRIDAQLLDFADQLKIVARAGAGVDNIDQVETARRGILLVNAEGANKDAVGDHTVGLILCLLNNICKSDREIRDYTWDREGNRGVELASLTVGIIGYGNTGSAVAGRLSSFGCQIIAFDKYRKGFSNAFCEEVSMQEIFEQTDILSLHVPLTSETENLINGDYLARFRKDIYLINASRGGVAGFKSLVEGLQSGKLLGVALDVLENEKINTLSVEQKSHFEQLCKSDKVILTPHVAGWSIESYEKISRILAERIIFNLK